MDLYKLTHQEGRYLCVDRSKMAYRIVWTITPSSSFRLSALLEPTTHWISIQYPGKFEGSDLYEVMATGLTVEECHSQLSLLQVLGE